MLQAVNWEMEPEPDVYERRRQTDVLRDRLSELDAFLFDLEDLNLEGTVSVPMQLRRRAAELVGETSRVPGERMPSRVVELMDLIFDVQERVCHERRRLRY